MGELLKNLESNNPTLVEESKNELIKSLSLTKENWLVYGMMEHFATQNSMKIVEILVKAPQSHDTFIFDKLLEWIQTNDKRNQAFKLFWLIIQKHPSWLYRVANHRLLRELLNTVKTERNFNTTLQGLFCIIILLPIIPALMNDYLHELFTIFLFLANWKATNHPELIGNQPVYLQNAIEKLFQSLYGMYPWNFVTFLREHVNDKTIKVIDPLVKNTRVHPMLLFSSPDVEKSQSRWKEMEPHDIVTECEKLAVDNAMKSHECDQEHINIPWYGRSIQVTPNQLSNERLRNTFAPISASETTTTRQQRIRSSNKWDNIWSPSSAVLATPPPTSNLAITQTPTPIFAQAIPGGQPYSSSGASPPEAAVEATPETTPLRDFGRPQRPYPVNSSAVRTLLGNSSQPSSPLKRDEHFRYPDLFSANVTTNEKFMKMMIDRNEEKHKSMRKYNDIEIQNPVCDNDDTLNVDSSKEDEEVTEINKFKTNKLTESQPNADKDTRSRQNLMKSHETKSMDDNFSEAVDEMFKMHDFAEKSKKCLANNSCAHETETELKTETETKTKTESKGKASSEQQQENFTVETQTDITMPIAWNGLIDKYVETSLKRHLTKDPSSRADMELQLLYLQLQYERYRRDVYAERNRRLLGKSRDNATLKTDIEKLKSQLETLSREHNSLLKNLNEAKMTQNSTEQKLSADCNVLRNDIQVQLDTNKKLQMNIESLDRRLAEEVEEKKRFAGLLESAQAEIFDLKNLLRQCQYQADVGTKYKEELQRLQSREVLMGEIKIKCNEKLVELENLRGRESEINLIKNACLEEVKELKNELASKSSLLDAAKERTQTMEMQLLAQKNIVSEQKRCVKMVKEEYEEKLKAVEAKYAAQKAIILRMEESILDPSKHRSEHDKSDTVGSLDHPSPLSMSLASSEGMSWSLKSVNDIKNLTHLLDNNSTAVFSPSSLNGEASSSNRMAQVSDDIPVPSSTSHSQFYPS